MHGQGKLVDSEGNVKIGIWANGDFQDDAISESWKKHEMCVW